MLYVAVIFIDMTMEDGKIRHHFDSFNSNQEWVSKRDAEGLMEGSMLKAERIIS